MRQRARLDDDALGAEAARATPATPEPSASTAAVFDAAGRTQDPGRGGLPAVGLAIDSLHASAGNGAISRLFAGMTSSRHREGGAEMRGGRTAVERPVVQASFDDDEPVPDGEAAAAAMDPAPAADPAVAAGDPASTAAADPATTADPALAGSDPATALADGAPTPGPSWTKVGPPTPATYTVTGTLREAANAVAARPEAGSVTTTPTEDTESWTPPGGSEKVTAARVTVAQVLELPTWSDKSKATPKQQAEWDRFHGAITTHENGHVSTDKTSFAGTHSKMVGQSPADATTALDTVTAKAKTDNATYDTNTGKGINQGTGINPNIDEVTKVP